MPRVIPVNLSIQDVKNLIASKVQLDAVVGALHQANWQGSKTAIAALGPVELLICDLYNRCEPYWLAYLNRGTAEPVAPSPADQTVPGSGGSPAGPVQALGGKV